MRMTPRIFMAASYTRAVPTSTSNLFFNLHPRASNLRTCTLQFPLPLSWRSPVKYHYSRLAAALVTLAALVGLPSSTARLGGQAPNGVVAIRNAKRLTATRGTIPNGTIVLQNGKIAALGANVTVPAGAEVVDGTGKFVSPGLIDAHSHIANDDINEGGTSVS